MTQRKIADGGMPPEQEAECVACMEDVRETYADAYDPRPPVLGMDAQPLPWLQETRGPIAATKQQSTRVDSAYARPGPARIVLCAEPRSGCRQATARVRRTKADGAIAVAQLLDTRSAACAQVTRVCDPRNTHTQGAVYEAFAPDRARADIQRIHFRDTPQHGRWLHGAACALRCRTSQGLCDRRSGARIALHTAIAVWSDKTHAKQRGVDWQCRIGDARVQLKRLYPKIKA